MTTYNTESLIGGEIRTDQAELAADTYYKGMPLQYDFTVPTTGTAGGSNVGDGTCTVVAAIAGGQPLAIGTYTLTCTAEVTNGGTFSLTNPGGVVMADALIMTAGAAAATVFNVGNLTFTITDGAEDFDTGDLFTIAVSAGSYSYLAGGVLGGFFMEDESRILSSAGAGSIIIGGEIQEGGIVDDSNAALTITDGMIAEWALLGFYVKRS